MAVLLAYVAVFLFILAFLLGGVAFVPAIVACVLLTCLALPLAVLSRVRRMVAWVILVVLATALSLCSAIVLGIKATGRTWGATLATLGWLVAFPLATHLLIRKRLVVIERGTIVIVGGPLIGLRALYHRDRVYGPLIPLLEKVSAILPAYELSYKIEKEEIKTQVLFDAIVSVCVYYEISDPLKVVYEIPNREKTIAEVIGEFSNKFKEEAFHIVSNWEKIIEKTIRQEVLTALHNVISNERGPVDVFVRQSDLGAEIKEPLDEMTSRWGVKVKHVNIEKVELHPASIQWFYKDTFMVMDDSIAHAEAQRRADALEVIEGMRTKMGLEMLDRLLQVIQKNITLPNKDIITLCLQATEQMFGPRRRYSLEVDPGALASIDKLVEAIKGREEVSH